MKQQAPEQKNEKPNFGHFFKPVFGPPKHQQKKLNSAHPFENLAQTIPLKPLFL